MRRVDRPEPAALTIRQLNRPLAPVLPRSLLCLRQVIQSIFRFRHATRLRISGGSRRNL